MEPLKNSFFIIFFLLIINDSLGQNPMTDWEKMKLKGKVKSFCEGLYSISKIEKGEQYPPYMEEEYMFNDKGYIIEKNHFYPYEELKHAFIYEYDTLGRLVEIQTFVYGIKHNKHTFLYDSDGNRIEDNIYNKDDSPNTKYISKFDENRNRIEMNGYSMNKGGKHFIKYSYKYDSKGNEIEERCEHSSGSSIKQFVYKYDSTGRIAEKYCYETSETGNTETKIIFKYDVHGNLIEENWGGVDGNVIDKDSYILDHNFNWIKKITEEYNQLLTITEREIEYFE